MYFYYYHVLKFYTKLIIKITIFNKTYFKLLSVFSNLLCLTNKNNQADCYSDIIILLLYLQAFLFISFNKTS